MAEPSIHEWEAAHLLALLGEPSRRDMAEALAAERERLIGIVTALWGADLATTQAAMRGEIALDEAMKR